MENDSNTAAGVMPVGAPMTEIRPHQVETVEGNTAPPTFDADAVATLVWENYQNAKNYVENNAWLLEWQETDILYQSPIPNRFVRVEQGRPPRVSRFIVAKNSRVMSRAVKRGLFADQYPFFLRPRGKTTQPFVDAWTDLIGVLLKRMKFKYHGGLLIDCQVLQGTGIGKLGWDERKVTKITRKRKTPPTKVELPSGTTAEVNTKESDEFEVKETVVTESWPFFEYRRLGTTLFDPKWCTPDQPDESAGYVIDIDYVDFYDLQRMRALTCYEKIPDDKTLEKFFFLQAEGSAPQASQVAESMTTSGSMVQHADSENRQTDADPLKKKLMLLEQWDLNTVKSVLCYNGRYLTIRNEVTNYDTMLHLSATWWPVENSGYGMGIGRINGPDQRINQGIINECLKMIAYPFNAPLVIGRGHNAPTQNVIQRLGGFLQLDLPPNDDIRKAVGFLDMPEIPADAWRMLELSQRGAEETSGANAPFQQGNLPGPGSSAARTAAGVNRISGMSDQSVADPVESFAEGVIIPTINFLVMMVKRKMPLREIREILSDKHAKIIEQAINLEQFLDADFEVEVLAGQKLAAKAGIQQLIPFFLQIVQQPQILEQLHQRGETVDFGVMIDILMQVSELVNQPDIIRALTPQEIQMLKMMNPGLQKVQGDIATEQVKGANRQKEIETKGEVDRANKAAEIVMQHTADGIPLARAAGLVERSEDVDALKNGLPDFTA